MGLNKSTGNMYEFITHTWNTIKGACPHGCSYCYMHRWGKQRPVRFDERELKTDLGQGNFIFVGSSCDMFACGMPEYWITKTLEYLNKYDKNKYLFQSKNPKGFETYEDYLKTEDVLCLSLESNRNYPDIMGQSPSPIQRINDFGSLGFGKLFITVEPILDFDFETFFVMITSVCPEQVNIGADSGNNNLPEPSADKILALIDELSKFTKVVQKLNLKRLLA